MILADWAKKEGSKMVIKFEIEHTIKNGQEANALEFLRDLRRDGSDYSTYTLCRGFLFNKDFVEWETIDGYIGETDDIHALLDSPAKIRLRLSS